MIIVTVVTGVFIELRKTKFIDRVENKPTNSSVWFQPAGIAFSYYINRSSFAFSIID
jgi:hypothetical protein